MTRFSALLLIPLAALAVSCGSDDATSNQAGASVAPPADGASPDGTAQPSSGDVGATTPPPPSASSNLGSCDVVITGGIDVSFSAPGGTTTAYSRYWFSEQELSDAGLGIADAPVFQLSCSTAEGLTVLVSSWDETQVPYGPGTVELAPNEVSVTSPDVLVANDTPVTMTLTQFDDAGMAGSFEFTTPSSSGAEALAGSVVFDLANPF